MRHAIASILLHGGLLGGLYLLVGMRPALSELDAESMAVEILSVDSFATNAAEAVDTQATETLVAAGAEPAPPVPADATPIAAAEPIRETVTLLAARVPAIEPVELAPPEVPQTTPASEPVHRAEPVEARTEPAPREPARTSPAPRKSAPPAASAGNGGKADADSAARAASGGQGKANEGGSAATSRYPGQVQSKVTRASRYPAKAKGASGEVVVAFTVAADGSVRAISVGRSSGNALLDEAALAAVARAAPFPPIPADAGRSSWTFSVPLAFRR